MTHEELLHPIKAGWNIFGQLLIRNSLQSEARGCPIRLQTKGYLPSVVGCDSLQDQFFFFFFSCHFRHRSTPRAARRRESIESTDRDRYSQYVALACTHTKQANNRQPEHAHRRTIASHSKERLFFSARLVHPHRTPQSQKHKFKKKSVSHVLSLVFSNLLHGLLVFFSLSRISFVVRLFARIQNERRMLSTSSQMATTAPGECDCNLVSIWRRVAQRLRSNQRRRRRQQLQTCLALRQNQRLVLRRRQRAAR